MYRKIYSHANSIRVMMMMMMMIVMAKLNGQAGLSVCVEKLLGAETTPPSGSCRSDVGFGGGAGGYHLLESTLVYE